MTQLGVFLAALYAANATGEAFKRGSMAMTYLVQPLRSRVAAAQAITYAGVSAVVAAAAAATVVVIVLTVAGSNQVETGLSAADVAGILAGAALGGAILGAAATLVGFVARHPTTAGGAIVVWSVAETLFTRGGTEGGIGAYLPFQLAGSLTGLSDNVDALPAIALLLGYLALLGIAVFKWALPRDLT
jgi:hypothetical protein